MTGARDGAATRCRRCGTVPGEGHRFCEQCGLDLAARSAGSADAVAPTGPCPDCGTPRPRGAVLPRGVDTFCVTCGLLLPDGTDHVESALPGTGMAGVSDRGLVHARNEDAMAFGVRTDTGARAAVVCDGVSTTRRPQDASRAASDAALAVLMGADPAGLAARPAPAEEERAPQTGRTIRVRAAAGDEALFEPGADPESDLGAGGELLARACAAAADAVAALAPPEQDSPSCTLVSVLVEADGGITVAWVGDSRAYWLAATPEDPSVLLTRDHSWAAELVAAGVMNVEDAMRHPRAHAITRWLGADGTRSPELRRVLTDTPGTLLICSDGLWNDLPDAEQLAAVVQGAPDLEGAVAELTHRALAAGGHDNITVVAIEVPGRKPA